uniref:Uncharacterized protein n=1 Tax=Pithovirus LCPAC403 TaxID=2506596 RepID=A0A481ZET9_9VIRU|nr:MAG: uncharacterized protein LCPAC403_02350 [Pithovirus LCPAC403]
MDPYYGNISCQCNLKNGNPCTNGAYWRVEEEPAHFRCGNHSEDIERTKLVIDPGKKKNDLIKERYNEAEEAMKSNKGKGNVICGKTRFKIKTPYTQGYFNVFPNYRHQDRKGGFGCSSLSPMIIGPIEHGQPGLPNSVNLENFYQGNKVFKDEIYGKNDETNEFFETQLIMYNDKIPHRHKIGHKGKTPRYWLWKTKNGSYEKLGYIDSRQFYCTFYERMVKYLPDLKKLKEMVEEGWNLQILGYDGNSDLTVDTIEDAYLDVKKPFGHESVLFTILTIPEEQYPWTIHKTEELWS